MTALDFPKPRLHFWDSFWCNQHSDPTLLSFIISTQGLGEMASLNRRFWLSETASSISIYGIRTSGTTYLYCLITVYSYSISMLVHTPPSVLSSIRISKIPESWMQTWMTFSSCWIVVSDYDVGTENHRCTCSMRDICHPSLIIVTTVIDLPTHQRTRPKFLAKRLQIRARAHKITHNSGMESLSCVIWSYAPT